jgi:shikimate kinase
MADAHFPPLHRPLLLTGIMGAGKTSVGRKLAARLGLPFADSDTEIETAASMTIAQFFENYGEAEFRKGERRVIARLLDEPTGVISTGGGAFMDIETRALIKDKAISIWLHADIETLLRRTGRRDDRPLLRGVDPRQRLTQLVDQRGPVYATADIKVISDDRPVDEPVEAVITALKSFLSKEVAP